MNIVQQLAAKEIDSNDSVELKWGWIWAEMTQKREKTFCQTARYEEVMVFTTPI